MADKITKFLKSLSAKDYAILIDVLERISKNSLSGFDIKKMIGYKSLYRIRKGNYRIIFEQLDGRNMILSIDKRDGNTYRDF